MMTHKDIAAQLNMTIHNVRMVEQRAITKLQMECVRRGLRLDDVLVEREVPIDPFFREAM